MSATEILAKARELPPEERREIAEALLEDLESQEEDLTPEQIAELDRRAEHALNNPGSGVPIEEVFAKIEKRLARPK